MTLTAVGVTDTQTAPAGALTTGPTCPASPRRPPPAPPPSPPPWPPASRPPSPPPTRLTQADLEQRLGQRLGHGHRHPADRPGRHLAAVDGHGHHAQTPALTVVKSVTSTGPYNTVGQTIDYQFVATNTGNVTLTAVGVTDTQTAPAGACHRADLLVAVTGPDGTCTSTDEHHPGLPGQAATFTATYTITQADLDNGSVTDSATATGTPPTGPAVTATPSTASVTIAQTAGADRRQVGHLDRPLQHGRPGDRPTSSSPPTPATSPSPRSASPTPRPPRPAARPRADLPVALAGPRHLHGHERTTLLPGQSATFTATYTLTQADLNNGSVADSATATRHPADRPARHLAPRRRPRSTVARTPALTVVKTVTSTGPYNTVGQTIAYQFVATNTGNVTLTRSASPTPRPPRPGPSPPGRPASAAQHRPAPAPARPHHPGRRPVGHLHRHLHAHPGRPRQRLGGRLGHRHRHPADRHRRSPRPRRPPRCPTAQTPALTVVKSVTSTGPYNTVGQTIDYQFVATNTGNVTLTAVGVTDTQTAPAGALATGPTCRPRPPPRPPAPARRTTLAPGQSATFTATYTLTQADLDNGSVNDSATASGTPPTGPASPRPRRRPP